MPNLKLPELDWSKLPGWKLALAGFVAWSVIMALVLWHSGVGETRDAFDSGRRLLIHLDNGKIEGHQHSLEPAAPTTEAPAQEENKGAESEKPVSSSADTTLSLPPEINEPLASEPVPGATAPLAQANEALQEKSEDGPLPIIAADGTKPWRYYAKPYEHKGSAPMIAIVVTGLGVNKSATEAAVRLPENVALSFSPYARDIATWASTARGAGHEVLIDLPLEPNNYPATDPGPYGLMAAGKDKNDARLKWIMARFTGYIGFLTPQNDAFSANGETLKWLLDALAGRGLMLVVGHEPAKSETKQALDTTTTPNVIADLLLDEDLTATAIQTRLASLEQIAKSHGYAIGIAQAFPVTIEQLKTWSTKLKDKGYVLVPVTFIAKLRFS